MSSKEAIGRALEAAVKNATVDGVALVSRDGLCIHAAGRQELARETFSAMTATLVGAAEIAMSEIGAGKVGHILLSTPGGSMLLIGVDRETLLTAQLPSAAPTHDAIDGIRRLAAEIAELIAG